MKCSNDKPVMTDYRGSNAFCCHEHCEEYCNEINNKKNKKISKSDE